jgi:enterochelin esterase-like enzyme
MTAADQGWLDSPWPGVGLTVLVVLFGLLLARTAGRGGGPVKIAFWIAGITLTAVLASLAFVNAIAGYVPDATAAGRIAGFNATSTAGNPSGGTVVKDTLGSVALDVKPSPVWVYLPPGYGRPGNTRRYPVVYLLHGYPGWSVDWFSAGRIDHTMDVLIHSGRMPPALVVAPDMNGGHGMADTEGLNLWRGPQVQTYLVRTVPDWVDRTFRTIARPADRIIGGMSAGGYVALNLGLKYQSEFGGIIAQEPYGDPGLSTLPELGDDRAAYAANSPAVYLPTIRFRGTEPTFIDVGSLAATNGADKLAQELRRRHQPVEYRVEAGQRHTWTEARLGIAYGLVWTAYELNWGTPASVVAVS